MGPQEDCSGHANESYDSAYEALNKQTGTASQDEAQTQNCESTDGTHQKTLVQQMAGEMGAVAAGPQRKRDPGTALSMRRKNTQAARRPNEGGKHSVHTNQDRKDRI